MQVSLKGARALIKVFTDLQVSVEDIQSWFSVGLEPVIGLVRLSALVTLISFSRPLHTAQTCRQIQIMHPGSLSDI